MTQEIIDRIRTLAEPVLRDVDIELVEIQYRREEGVGASSLH